MDVDGHVERRGGGEDVPKLLVVQILALRVRVDDRAFQAELSHAALELRGSGRRVLRRNRGEAREPRRMGSDCGRELVVGRARERRARRGIENLHAR
jgi:hypothetical protein